MEASREAGGRAGAGSQTGRTQRPREPDPSPSSHLRSLSSDAPAHRLHSSASNHCVPGWGCAQEGVVLHRKCEDLGVLSSDLSSPISSVKWG